jgi:hypothetical protein
MFQTTKLQELLNKEILKNFKDSDNGSWNEDIITRDILRVIKNFMSEPSNFIFLKNKIKWNMYKATKKNNLEQKFGDIAFLIKLVFSETKFIEGVYFFEAKRFYFDSNNYQSINFENAKKYINYSHAHNFLFYTINHYKILDSYDNILTVPTQHIIALNTKSKDIEEISEDFTVLFERLLRGYHLEYNKNIIDDVKGFSSNTGKTFEYLINIVIPMNPSLNYNLSEVNSNKYDEFKLSKSNTDKDKKPKDDDSTTFTLKV